MWSERITWLDIDSKEPPEESRDEKWVWVPLLQATLWVMYFSFVDCYTSYLAGYCCLILYISGIEGLWRTMDFLAPHLPVPY